MSINKMDVVNSPTPGKTAKNSDLDEGEEEAGYDLNSIEEMDYAMFKKNSMKNNFLSPANKYKADHGAGNLAFLIGKNLNSSPSNASRQGSPSKIQVFSPTHEKISPIELPESKFSFNPKSKKTAP